jgi:hypothetical protein
MSLEASYSLAKKVKSDFPAFAKYQPTIPNVFLHVLNRHFTECKAIPGLCPQKIKLFSSQRALLQPAIANFRKYIKHINLIIK